MSDPTIILGLDLGDRHIGVAVGNTLTHTATPLSDLTNDRSLIERLRELQDQYNYSKIIVGLPITATGQYGDQAQKVQDLISELRAALSLEIVLEDERFTTQAAIKYLHDHPESQASLDGIAAQFILEGWLARQAPS